MSAHLVGKWKGHTSGNSINMKVIESKEKSQWHPKWLPHCLLGSAEGTLPIVYSIYLETKAAEKPIQHYFLPGNTEPRFSTVGPPIPHGHFNFSKDTLIQLEKNLWGSCYLR